MLINLFLQALFVLVVLVAAWYIVKLLPMSEIVRSAIKILIGLIGAVYAILTFIPGLLTALSIHF